jgi:LuxR family maltose regulon positive regulatory protein
VVSQGIVPRPALLGRLDSAARVTMVSAPAGSGKTLALQSWMSAPGRAECTAWVPVQREERDEQRFWLQVASALRGTVPGAALVRRVTAAPDLDGWTIAERLLTDLASLRDQLWLVIDDLHELPSDQALRQLELVIQRAPPTLRFVLSARQEPRLGLHRLRLAGEVAEVRADDLRFTDRGASAVRRGRGAAVGPGAHSAAPADRGVGGGAAAGGAVAGRRRGSGKVRV